MLFEVSPETDVQRDRGSRGRLCTVADAVLWASTVPRKCNSLCTCTVCDVGLKESTAPPKFKRMCTVPDGGLEESSEQLMCNRLCTVADAALWVSTVP